MSMYKKLTTDTLWNLGSLVILAVCGIILNIIIARFYGAYVLGVFNQVFAVYIILSQFAAGGLYFSTIKFVAEFSQDKKTCSQIVSSAVALGAAFSVVVCLGTYFLKDLIGYVLQSYGVTIGILCIIPGLCYFALNKILLAAINGLEHMRVYAMGQSLRYGLIMIFVVLLSVFKMPGSMLPLAFTAAEAILLVLTSFYFFRLHEFVLPSQWGEWPRKHLQFALKAFPGGLLTDLNTRVDVLMLGVFLGDKSVGVYSFASILAEGFLQIPFAICVCVNPKLTQLASKFQYKELKEIIAKTKSLVVPMMAGLGILAVAVFPGMIKFFVGTGEFGASWKVFMILMVGIIASSGYWPFQMLLNQAHHPGTYTLFMGSFVLSNVILNVLLIPRAGIYGAAVATAIALILSIVYLKFYVKRTMRISI